MRLVFMGTPAFCLPILAALHARHEVVAAYTQPPRPAGRGQQPRPSPVALEAGALGIPVRHPASLRGEAEARAFADLDADAAVVAAYGLILPQAVLDAPRAGCLNVHASLLPRWRGAAPIQRAIMARDAETGISIMAMEAGLDTGPVLAREAVAIAPDDTAQSLHDRLAGLGAALMLDVLDRLADLTPEPQDEAGATYAAKIDKAEARVDWTLPARVVDAQIRALSPRPGAWCMAGDARLRLLQSRVVAGEGAPGTVLGGATVACGNGAVEIVRAQREGRRPVDGAEIARAGLLPARLD